MKLSHLKTFLALAKNNCNFSIHTVLGISRSTMWAHISDIESEVGFKLVNRRKQNTTFTEDGEMFIPYAKKIHETFEDSLAKMNTKKGKGVPGELVISSTKAIAEGWLLAGMREFSDQYPEINTTIVAEDYLSKNLINSADIFLRPMHNLANITKKWCTTYKHGLFASKSYLDRMGIPQDVEDLVEHRIISYGEQEFSGFEDVNWHLNGKGYGLPNKLTPTLSINSTSAIYVAAQEGLGICSAAIEANLIFKGNLVHILPEIVGPSAKAYFAVRDGFSDHKKNNITLFKVYLEKYLATLGLNLTYE